MIEAHGDVTVISCYAPWGIGTYTFRDPDVDDAIALLRDKMTDGDFEALEGEQ